VQEVYDSRVLHQMVGVDPVSSLLSTKPSSSRSQVKTSERSRGADTSVQAAWKAIDSDQESGEERTHRSPRMDEEEESRYGIGDKKQPPMKRRRMGTDKDLHTVYISDEEEDSGSSASGRSEHLILHADMGPGSAGSVEDDSDSDSVAAEEAEYTLDHEDDKKTKAQNRRSYWLSKGTVML
jgi:non-canonical poly(A) RNA polymerase PAPD5/7